VDTLLHNVSNNHYNLENFEKNMGIPTSNVIFSFVLSGKSRATIHEARKKLEEGMALGSK